MSSLERPYQGRAWHGSKGTKPGKPLPRQERTAYPDGSPIYECWNPAQGICAGLKEGESPAGKGPHPSPSAGETGIRFPQNPGSKQKETEP